MTAAGRPPVALVTGAARGIGAAVVRRLLDRGYVVHALDVCAPADGLPYALATRADLDAVVALAPDRVVGVVADVRDPEALRAAVADAVRREGGVDTVVAAAAVMAGGSALWETSEEQLRLVWETDALGVWHTAAAAVPALLESAQQGRSPAFVAIASTAADRGLWRLSAYVVAKHAVVGIVRGLAADLTGTGVTACAVSPGSTDTAMLRATADVYGVPVEELSASMAAGRPMTPDEVAAVVELGCTAGPVVHGAVLPATGGFS